VIAGARRPWPQAILLDFYGTIVEEDDPVVYWRDRSGEVSDAELEAWHNETIARVKSEAIVVPRASRPSVYDLGELQRHWGVHPC
jgi:hypothetical protein